MIILEDLINIANARGRFQDYLAQNSRDISMFDAVVEAINNEITTSLPVVVATISTDINYTVDGTVTNIPIIATVTEGLYTIYATQMVTATTAATGTHSLTLNLDAGAGPISPSPTTPNPMDLTVVGSSAGSVTYRLLGGSTLEYNIVVVGMTTGNADVSVRITVVKLPT